MMQASSKGYICVFACRWCSLLGAGRAGRDHLEMPAGIRLIPVSCAGSVSADHVIQALTNGAAGVAVLGCHLGGCRHNDANRDAHARLDVLGSLLETVGIDRRRLLVSWGTAHEAEQYARLMRDFAALLESLPPDLEPAPASDETPLRNAPLGPLSSPSEDEALRTLAARAMHDGHVVLALRRTDMGPLPCLFRTEEELKDIIAGPKWPMAKCAGLILKDRALGAVQGPEFRALREEALSLGDSPLSVACRACDARALRELVGLRQFPEEALSILPVLCSEERKEACNCPRPQWPGEALPEDEGESPADLQVNAGFWREQFSRCVQCHWCREACPVCVCPSCSLDNPSLTPLGPQSSPLGYHLARAMHVADACALCGACQDACPRHLPLLKLHQAVSRALRTWNYASGDKLPSPLRAERCIVAASGPAVPQWKHNLGGK